MARSWRPLMFALVSLLVCAIGATDYLLRAQEGAPAPQSAASKERARRRAERKLKDSGVPVEFDPNEPLVAPPNWPKGHPLPQVASNCARCHLTAGRELTLAVKDFTHSVHDLNELSCNDCHGGNTKNNVSAHENEFGFIGTKLSAHIARCSECHTEEAVELSIGPHAWDFSKRINTKFPMCIDCHGNHDVGNPPIDFKLADVCADCHKDPKQEFPQLTAVVAENDLFWQTIAGVRDKLGATTERLPPGFADDVAKLRHARMLAMHQSKELTPEAGRALVDQTATLRARLAEWVTSGK